MSNLKKCPFCKGYAEIVKDPLWNGSHGYHGDYKYYVRCSNSNCVINPKTKGYNTTYEKNEELQKQRAIDDWNNREQK